MKYIFILLPLTFAVEAITLSKKFLIPKWPHETAGLIISEEMFQGNGLAHILVGSSGHKIAPYNGPLGH